MKRLPAWPKPGTMADVRSSVEAWRKAREAKVTEPVSSKEKNENQSNVRMVRPVDRGILGQEQDNFVPLPIADDRNENPDYACWKDEAKRVSSKPGIPPDLCKVYESTDPNGFSIHSYPASHTRILIERIAKSESEVARLRAEVERLTKAIESRENQLRMQAKLVHNYQDLKAELSRLKQPVSRHNDADGILQRFFITGGRQYRYVREDAVDLEKLLNEWLASRSQGAKEQGVESAIQKERDGDQAAR